MASHTPGAQQQRRCPGRCGRHVSLATVACPTCWSRLPRPVRTRIQDTFNAEDLLVPHAHAVGDALAWFRAHRDDEPQPTPAPEDP